MTYPGDPALASDVQQRILTTFQQTLELASQGNKTEALLGCDFILRLDPGFTPARTLQQMVNAGRVGPELRELFSGSAGGASGESSEADPYIRTFLDSARQALAMGDDAEADRLVKKARTLDANHPGIASFDRERAAASSSAAPAFDLPDVDFSSVGDDSLFGAGAAGGENAGRIQELLSEGQRAFERGEHQGAIDAWSRIFLIDIDHHEAARRIEEARRLKAEREREVEELFHGGVAQFDANDFGNAERSFRRVLEISPGYLLAQEYLDKIAERQSGGPAVASVPPPPAAGRPAEGAADKARGARPGRDKPAGEILVPPEPGAAKSRPSRGEAPRTGPGYGVAAKKKRGGPMPNFLLIGGGVLALLLAGGWFLLRNGASLFPNARDGRESAVPAASDPIARAKALHADGKTAIALAQLRRLPPQEPSYAEAQSLISQWEALVKPAEPVPAGLAPEVRAKRDSLLATADRACREGENLRCKRALEKAAAILPLDAAGTAQLASATQNLAPLDADLKMFADGEYEDTLNRLWRAREADPTNHDIKQLIVDSYYNVGVMELQRGDPAAAADKFREARALDGADEEVERLESFSIAYSQRSDDLLFKIFVRNLVNR